MRNSNVWLKRVLILIVSLGVIYITYLTYKASQHIYTIILGLILFILVFVTLLSIKE